jgi:anthranilate synthase component 1
VAALGKPLFVEPSVPPDDPLTDFPELRRTVTLDAYALAVEAAREYILAGDIFQVVLAQRFDLVDPVDPVGLYRVLRLVNPSPYMYILRFRADEPVTVVGSSPEALVHLRDGCVTSRPIAGTRKRGRDAEHDRRLEAELVEHPKERAEHVMLVDLARNDVGRVVRFGTEHVDELMTLERYSHVMHLTSQVSGELADGLGPVDVVRATFPAGTVSGAPKVRAMEIIDELEPTKRGPYAGVVGYFDFTGNLDVAITIRTMVFRGTQASISAGAGIVVDSVAEDEDLECRNKAAALLTAARAAQLLFPVGERAGP